MINKIAVLVIVNTEKEIKLFEELVDSIKSAEDNIKENFSVDILTYPGTNTIKKVFKLRGEIISNLSDEYSHLISLDPDDLVHPKGFASAIKECAERGNKGILLKEQVFGEEWTRYKHCCRLLIRTDLAKELVTNTLIKGFNDQAHAQCAVAKFDLPKSTEVAHLTRVRKDAKTPEWVRNLITEKVS